VTHTYYNKILFLPDAGPKNPFQHQMIALLRQHGLKVSVGPKNKLFSIYKGVHLSQPELVYFDWIHSFILGKSLIASLIKSLVFVTEIIYVTQIRKIPIIHTAHNLENHAKRKLWFERIIYGFFLNRCHKIRVYSEAVKKNLVEKFRLNSNSVHIIQDIPYHHYYPNHTTRKESRIPFAIPADAVLFLFFGRIQPYKGLENLIHSFLQIAASNNYLIIAGEAIDEKYLLELRKLTQFHTRITWHHGFIDMNDVQYFFHAADAIVLPFTKSDHSGTVDLALSFAKAVITLKTEAIQKLLAHQEFLLFGTPHELLSCLTKATKIDLGDVGKQNFKIANETNYADLLTLFQKE